MWTWASEPCWALSECWDILFLPATKREEMKKRFMILKWVSKLAVSIPGRVKLNTAYPHIRIAMLVQFRNFWSYYQNRRVCLDREISTQRLGSELEAYSLPQVLSPRRGWRPATWGIIAGLDAHWKVTAHQLPCAGKPRQSNYVFLGVLKPIFSNSCRTVHSFLDISKT